MVALSASVFALSWWLGLYLLARNPRKAVLVLAALGLTSFALVVALDAVRVVSGAEVLSRVEIYLVALPGIAVRPLPVAPRQIPFHAGAVYFELDRGSPHWQQMQSSGGFALHVSGDFPALQMELWAIRG